MTKTNFPTYLAAEITRKEVILDLETVISSYVVATGPDFFGEKRDRGILFNHVSFVIPFKQTLI